MDWLVLPEEFRNRYDLALVVNFGGQYAHLIARRLREQGVYTEIVSYDTVTAEHVERSGARLLVLSGGPSSVYSPNAPIMDSGVLDTGIPVLGICYGHQLIASLLGGRVERGRGEYGRTLVKLVERDPLFEGWGSEEEVWMSHADYVAEPPPGFRVLAVSENGYIAAMRHEEKPIYGVQFHPEVRHTPKGDVLLRNYAYRVAGVSRTWKAEKLVETLVSEIRRAVGGEDKVLVAVSGGVDSTVTAVLVRRAVGDRLVAVFVDHGLLREGEAEEVVEALRSLGIELVHVDARERFLSKLMGVEDCEERRRIIGEEFARIFREIVERDPEIKWLAQGTTYPDIIESGAVKGADRIKSHHNVAGLPAWLGLRVLEPIKYFYKDEVRRIAEALGVPKNIVYRHPFPGPGLAVRVMGKLTLEKLEVARRASRIVEEELARAGLYRSVWQAFAAVGDDRWVGVKGDQRSVGYVVTIRIVESEDAMTADWARVPYEVLDRISRRITSEIPQVTMVTYAVTTKPPSTIEPC